MPKSSWVSSTPSRRPDEAEALHRAGDRARLRLDAGRPDGAPSRHPLHWPIAFPEVFDARDRKHGFDAMVANPPFIGGQKITGAAGTDYRNHVLTWIGGGVRGSADLVAYFFLNATKISAGHSATWPPTPSRRATPAKSASPRSSTWAGRSIAPSRQPHGPVDATLEIAKVWATAHPWSGQHVLDGRPVAGIDEMLYPLSRSGWRKRRLAANADKSFQGSIVLGMGFTMSPEEAQALIDQNPNNADVLRPYLGGEDLNQSPTHTAPRWIINFFDWPDREASRGSIPTASQSVHERIEAGPRDKVTKNAVGRRRATYSGGSYLRPTSKKLYRTIAPLEQSSGDLKSQQDGPARLRADRAGAF